MRLRSIIVMGLVGYLLYRFGPKERRQTVRGKLREFGRILLITIVIYWIWLLGSYLVREWF